MIASTLTAKYQAVRTPWGAFPPVVLHSPEGAVKQHPDYAAAKAGDSEAAFRLVKDTVSQQAADAVRLLLQGLPATLVSAHAVEREGVNAIPEALADELGSLLQLAVDQSLVQVNIVGHTGASGYARLARPALFSGDVVTGARYVLVDDFVGQGGTLANLKGYIESQGGLVMGATALTGKPFSSVLTPTSEQLDALRRKHGSELEDWWQARFGYGFDCLTQSEARYLERSPDVDTIRDRIAAEE